MKGLLLKDAYQTWCYIRSVSYTHLCIFVNESFMLIAPYKRDWSVPVNSLLYNDKKTGTRCQGKKQGCANDYIYLDCRTSGVPGEIAALSERLSRRHFSIGADGRCV